MLQGDFCTPTLCGLVSRIPDDSAPHDAVDRPLTLQPAIPIPSAFLVFKQELLERGIKFEILTLQFSFMATALAV